MNSGGGPSALPLPMVHGTFVDINTDNPITVMFQKGSRNSIGIFVINLGTITKVRLVAASVSARVVFSIRITIVFEVRSSIESILYATINSHSSDQLSAT